MVEVSMKLGDKANALWASRYSNDKEIKIHIFSDDREYLGLVVIRPGKRPFIQVVPHGTMDVDVDAFGLKVDVKKSKISERHKIVELRYDGWNEEEWQKEIRKRGLDQDMYGEETYLEE